MKITSLSNSSRDCCCCWGVGGCLCCCCCGLGLLGVFVVDVGMEGVRGCGDDCD